MTLLPLIIPFAVLTLCALSDIATFKIPNRYVAILLLAWPPTMLLTGADPQAVGLSAAIGGVLLLLGFALFAANLLGAGDVKLISAAVLWVPPGQVAAFLLATTALGGVLGLGLLLMRARPMPALAHRAAWLVSLHERERVMPYGVAIAGGAMIAMGRGAGLA